MIRADLAVVGIAELATPLGTTARVGPDLARLRVLERAAVASRDGRIVFVGPEDELQRSVTLDPGGRQVDARGGTVIPGWVDAHTHLPFAGWREREFDERLRGSPIRRIGHERWLRNLAVGLGNAPASVRVVAALRARLDHPSALVREHVRWALSRHEAFAS